MIVRGELRLAIQLAGEQATRERHAHDHADFPGLRLAEEQLPGTLAEDVVDDLYRGDARVLDRLQRLFDLFDGHAVVADLAGRHQGLERLEYLGPVVDLRGRAVQLHEIERVHAEVLAAAIDEGFEILARVTAGHVRRKASPGLGGDDGPRAAPFLQYVADDAFRATIAIDIRRVDERGAGFERREQRVTRIGLGDVAPRSANGPGAETDFGDVPARAAERPGRNSHQRPPVDRLAGVTSAITPKAG